MQINVFLPFTISSSFPAVIQAYPRIALIKSFPSSASLGATEKYQRMNMLPFVDIPCVNNYNKIAHNLYAIIQERK